MGTKGSVLSSLIVYFLVCACNAQKIITAERGQDVILPSKVPIKETITAVVGENVTLSCPVPDAYKNFSAECSRSAQDTKPYLVVRDGHIKYVDQHPSYQNRMDLQDKEIKNGNLSATLMNATMEDAGEYHCRVFQGNNEPICSINLKVVEPGDKSGNMDGVNVVGPIVGPVVGVPAAAFVGFLIYKRCRRQNPNRSVPPHDEEVHIPMPHFLGQQQNQPHLLHL